MVRRSSRDRVCGRRHRGGGRAGPQDASTEVNVARYDMAHGVAHRDVLGRRAGLVSKTWFPDHSPESVFTAAVQDFKRNYARYIAEFTRH